jgi:esterase/lipase
MVDETAKEINLIADSNLEFFLIHGYTGSPTDFNELPFYLNKEFKANVRVPLLKGHGESISSLDNLKYGDFLNPIKRELKKEISNGKKIVLIGISFGGLMALDLAKNFSPLSVIVISLPFQFKFPLNVPGIGFLGIFKKYWKKYLSEEEKNLRQGFHYNSMHKNGFYIVNSLKKKLRNSLYKIKSPFLGIQVKNDLLSSKKGLNYVLKNIGSDIKSKVCFDTNIHNVFYSNQFREVYSSIHSFIKNVLESQNKSFYKKEKVAAIIPAYNEKERISSVLKILKNVKLLDEIIVVDDGSSDGTSNVVKKFKKIRLIENKVNKGKAFSMDVGVKSTKASILFFCDADLKGLKSKQIEEIILPVLNNKFDMFIGVRGNFMQRTIKKWAINSGERSLKREIWEKLPAYYKYRYRIEAGLNNYVRFFGEKGFGYKVFNYSQTLKESKYGFFKGTFLRWWMNLDVFMAVLRFHIWDRFSLRKKV